MSELRAAKTLEQLKELYDTYPQCHPPEGITLAQPEHSAAPAEAKSGGPVSASSEPTVGVSNLTVEQMSTNSAAEPKQVTTDHTNICNSK